ncbi:toxin-antitoxin system YwqK family antitoxin [Verrucomicrobiota bacterium]
MRNRFIVGIFIICCVCSCGKKTNVQFEYYDNGNLKKQHTTISGRQHGPMIRFHENGQLCSIDTYVNGHIEGKSRYWYSNGERSEEVDYKDSLMHGKGVIWTEAGKKVLECEYAQGRINGKIQRWTDEGELLTEGYYSNGVPWEGSFLKWDPAKKTFKLLIYSKGDNVSELQMDKSKINEIGLFDLRRIKEEQLEPSP